MHRKNCKSHYLEKLILKNMADTEDLAVNDVTAATQGVAALISEVGLPFHIITIGTCSSDMLLLCFVARQKKLKRGNVDFGVSLTHSPKWNHFLTNSSTYFDYYSLLLHNHLTRTVTKYFNQPIRPLLYIHIDNI